MYQEPLFYDSVVRSDGSFDRKKYPDLKVWVIKAIAEEEKKSNVQLWKSEPSAEFQKEELLRRIKFLRKHGKNNPLIEAIADRLSSCEKNSRCCSGTCPECGRLLQRWLVRKSKAFIRDVIDKDGRDLVAISIIPTDSIIQPGHLSTLSIDNFQRTLKYALDKIGLGIALGGTDFSFNEDKKGRYQPFWCPHYYLITSIANKRKVLYALADIYNPYKKSVPKPIFISPFENNAYCRSYALKIKFDRRIGFDAEKKKKDGTVRICRDTSNDRLRAAERLELFVYLNQCGFANRFIFRGAKPISRATKVVIGKV